MPFAFIISLSILRSISLPIHFLIQPHIIFLFDYTEPIYPLKNMFPLKMELDKFFSL